MGGGEGGGGCLEGYPRHRLRRTVAMSRYIKWLFAPKYKTKHLHLVY